MVVILKMRKGEKVCMIVRGGVEGDRQSRGTHERKLERESFVVNQNEVRTMSGCL